MALKQCIGWERSPQHAPVFLVGTVAQNQSWLTGCPHGATLLATDLDLERDLLITLPCRRWSCSWCGPRRLSSLAHRIRDAAPSKFITLTCQTSHYADPRDCFDRTRRRVPEWCRRQRARGGEFEYVRILEATAKGWPHYHLLVRSPFRSWVQLRNDWRELTGNEIIDVRKLDHRVNVYWYVLKYLAKQHSVPWTHRRIAWSRAFFGPRQAFLKQTRRLRKHARYYNTVARVLELDYQGQHVTRLADGVLAITPYLPKDPATIQCS